VTNLAFVHRYAPPSDGGAVRATTLLMLHGTGGDENDLLPLGQELLPGAGMLSPRGNVLERSMPRFFRRLAEGVFDLEDLAVRTDELATFVAAAAAEYGFDTSRLIAVGFSNGANIAASVMLKHPGAIQNAVLLSPMLPFEPDPLPDLAGTSAFIGAGKADAMIRPDQAQRLADIMENAGADITVHWHPGGHTITREELAAAKSWVAARVAQ
jgi:predicted esterase